MFHYSKKVLSKIRCFIQILCCNNIPLRFVGRVYFPHPLGIVIGDTSVIGNGVTIYQNVTIGRKAKSRINENPRIGDNVVIYPGAVVIGEITIGDNSIIGANTTVTIDIPAGSTVVGYNRILTKYAKQLLTANKDHQ
jgi:serine O-acetyltransferase